MNRLSELLATPLFSIGENETTLGRLLVVLAIVIATLWAGRIVRHRFARHFERYAASDKIAIPVYAKILTVLVYLVGIEIVLLVLGMRLGTLLAASGLFAFGAGLAIKNIVENFISGIIIRLEQTIKPDDIIQVKGQGVIVHRVGARVTIGRTYDGEEILIPNAMVSQSIVTNTTHHDRHVRISTTIGVSPLSDLHVVRKTLEDTVSDLEWSTGTPGVYLLGFGDSSVDYDVKVWIENVDNALRRRSDLKEAVWFGLKQAGIVIAFPQLHVHVDQSVLDSLGRRWDT